MCDLGSLRPQELPNDLKVAALAHKGGRDEVHLVGHPPLENVLLILFVIVGRSTMTPGRFTFCAPPGRLCSRTGTSPFWDFFKTRKKKTARSFPRLAPHHSRPPSDQDKGPTVRGWCPTAVSFAAPEVHWTVRCCAALCWTGLSCPVLSIIFLHRCLVHWLVRRTVALVLVIRFHVSLSIPFKPSFVYYGKREGGSDKSLGATVLTPSLGSTRAR